MDGYLEAGGEVGGEGRGRREINVFHRRSAGHV